MQFYRSYRKHQLIYGDSKKWFPALNFFVSQKKKKIYTKENVASGSIMRSIDSWAGKCRFLLECDDDPPLYRVGVMSRFVVPMAVWLSIVHLLVSRPLDSSIPQRPSSQHTCSCTRVGWPALLFSNQSCCITSLTFVVLTKHSPVRDTKNCSDGVCCGLMTLLVDPRLSFIQ